MSSFYVSTRFVWRFGGHQVHLCGSFTRWVETVPMAPVEGQPSVFSVIVHLPPGYHQYKFIVDGEWRHDETQPYMPDPLGNVNNWLFVRRPDSTHTPNAMAPLPNAPFPPTDQPAEPPAAPTPPTRPAAVETVPDAATPRAADVEMEPAEGSAAAQDAVPQSIQAPRDEPAFTRGKVHDFLSAHTAYELIPESGKVVVLDVELPVRQAFHALHEQSIASAPLWDPRTARVVGMISASDFIHVLRKLRSVSSGGNPMSEPEMDLHTIRSLREEGTAEGRPPRDLVYCTPRESLQAVVDRLFAAHCSMAPVLTKEPESSDSNVLHIATMSGVLACLMRHFRASVSSLPLLSAPVGSLPIGTWSPEAPLVQAEAGKPQQGALRHDQRKVQPLHCVQLETPLTAALQMLLDTGVSVLPVVDKAGALIDLYARGDISTLARGNAYSRLQWEELTVGQALALASASPQWPNGSGGTTPARQQRVYACTAEDPLRAVVERLSVPGVRRVFVVAKGSNRVEGIVSLSDVAAFLFFK